MRKHVKPAHPQAAMPDPVRGGNLPSDGVQVEWTAYWARLAQRGDVVATDLDETGPTAKSEKRPSKSPASGRAAPNARRSPAKTKLAPKPAPLPSAPDGDAPAESDPQPEDPILDSPDAPAAPEPSIT